MSGGTAKLNGVAFATPFFILDNINFYHIIEEYTNFNELFAYKWAVNSNI